MSKKASSLSRILLVGAAVAPLWLAACTSDGGPYPMPSGYKHHADKYIAPNGPEMTKMAAAAPVENTMPVADIRYEEPKVKAAVVPVVEPAELETEQWQTAADSLIRDMTVHFGLPQLPVYVEPGKSVQEQSLAAALVNSLTDKKIAVSTERGVSPYALSYMIINPMDAGDTRKMVKIKLSDYDKVIAEESGLFNIGADGRVIPMNDNVADSDPVPVTAPKEEAAPSYQPPMEPQPSEPESTQDVGAVHTTTDAQPAPNNDKPVAMTSPASSPSASYNPPDKPLARPRSTAMSDRMGGASTISSVPEMSDDEVSAAQDFKSTAHDTMDVMQAEEQYQNRIVSMPAGAEDGSAMPVPLTSSLDDR